MATANLKRKPSHPSSFNISRPHVSTNSKFSLFSGTRGVYVSCVSECSRDVELAPMIFSNMKRLAPV
jgi:hypothetical protein